jgi:hypothetical protein
LTPAEKIQFDKHCIEYFGLPASGVLYRWNDIEDRLKATESRLNQVSQLFGAVAIKQEASSNLLINKDIVTENELDNAITSIAKSTVGDKKVKKLKGL